jgi:hypothetical protein
VIVLGVVLDNDAIFLFEGYGNFFLKKMQTKFIENLVFIIVKGCKVLFVHVVHLGSINW